LAHAAKENSSSEIEREGGQRRTWNFGATWASTQSPERAYSWPVPRRVTEVGVRIRDAKAATHRGKRGFNEDAVLRLPEVPLYAIADGMGGPGAGDVAASYALEFVKGRAEALKAANARVAESRSTADRLALVRLVDEIFNQASRGVQEEASRLHKPGMGATLVLATVVRNYLYVAHVGDSRAYLFRDGRLLPLTEDHTLAELHYRRGKISKGEYQKSPERRVLYQALGAGIEVDGDLAEIRLTGGDVILLCSDGLPRAIDDEEIAKSLDPEDLKASITRLFDLAVKAGAPDNVSVVLLSLESEEGDEPIEAVTEVMREVFLFKPMSQPELLTIAPYLEEIVCEKGATITGEAEPLSGFHVVVSGAVRLTRGKTHLVDVKPGGCFGELALTQKGAREATARALVPTRMFVLTRERFHELLRAKPELGARLALALLEAVAGRVRDMGDRLAAVERAARGELK
jgi:protein phosphatase